ncbi:unnamed protein product [Arabidopsis lyrata]|nr:unnamed protein product [Arabidopsis lyrata]
MLSSSSIDDLRGWHVFVHCLIMCRRLIEVPHESIICLLDILVTLSLWFRSFNS